HRIALGTGGRPVLHACAYRRDHAGGEPGIFTVTTGTGYMTSERNLVEPPEYPWLGMDAEAVSADLLRHYHLTLGRGKALCGEHYLYQAAALTVRDRLVERWRKTRDERQPGQRRVAY